MTITTKAFIEALKIELEKQSYVFLKDLEKEGDWGRLYLIYSNNDQEERVIKVYKDPIDNINIKIFEKEYS